MPTGSTPRHTRPDRGSDSPAPGTPLAIAALRRAEDATDLPPRATVVVLDVLRATTTMVAALESGADRIIPVADLDAARSLRDSIPRALLIGERQGVPPAGFDAGNSPGAMTPEFVAGRTLVISTTNGTRAIAAAQACRRVIIGALVNAAAVAAQLLDDPGPIVFLCAGADGEPGLEDELAAGAIIDGVAASRPTSCDRVAERMRMSWNAIDADDRTTTLRMSRAGAALIDLGLGADVDFAARLDTSTVVGELTVVDRAEDGTKERPARPAEIRRVGGSD